MDFCEKDDNIFLILVKKDCIETKKISNETKSIFEKENHTG